MNKSVKILIVEDEKILANDMQRSLENVGYTVTGIVFSGKQVLRRVKETQPDLVLIDIMLQGEMDGIEAADQIRSRFNIPVVYVTAYADEKTIEKVKRTEPFGYILKPFGDYELRGAIEMALYKHKVESQLKESEERNRDLVERAGIGILVHDQEGRFTYFNERFAELFGYSMEEMKKQLIQSLVHPDDIARVMRFHEDRIRGKRVASRYEFKGVRKDDSPIYLEADAVVLKEREKNIGTRLYMWDITERKLAEQASKQAEEKLKESEEQLRNLAAHLQSAREEERTNVAREIHDELGQALTALKMDLSWLKNRLGEDQKTLLRKAKSMEKLIDSTIHSVKRISTELRPGLLDDLGLSAAIEWQAEEFQNRTGIECKVVVNPEDIVLDQDRSTAIFRIFQEALTNVARHAEATKVDVRLRCEEDRLELVVRDNGKGIAEEKISNPKSFGLVGIRERAASIGGDVEIRGSQNRGTAVTATIPLP